MSYTNSRRGLDLRRESPASHFFHRRRQLRETALLKTFDEVFSRHNLFRAMCHIAHEGGAAAGIDGVSPRDLTGSEMGNACEIISRVVLAGKYQSSPPRHVRIPKSRPGEFRTLSIPVLADRTVALTLHRAFAPRFEKMFLQNSHGFRARRSPATLLAQLLCLVGRENRWFLASDDVRGAFDNVRLVDAVAAHERAMAEWHQNSRGTLSGKS